jgi:hypothetical protein
MADASRLDVDGGLAGASVPTRTVTGPEEAQYVEALCAALRAARLSANWPDSRALVSHLSVLAPATHCGLYDGVEVDLRSGLPSYREWTRAQTDARLAPEQLRQLGPRHTLAEKARRGGAESIHAKQLAKHDYYTRLLAVQLTTLGDMHVALRRLEPEQRRAHFHVVLDKLDVSGVFVRYSIDLAQRDDFWNERVVVLDEEAARHTETFRSLIYKLTSYDAELTFVKLATLATLTVERVVKGVVGPFFFPWVRCPEPLRPVVATGGFVATFALDMAAVDLAADRDNDPLEDLRSERLSPEARAGYEDSRRRYGYKVFKDRKFVCGRGTVEPLRALCTARGAASIVYPM